MDLYTLTFGLLYKIIDLAQVVYQIIFTTLEIGAIKVSVWELIGGIGFLTVFTLWIVKKFVPLT